jgi:hypothetical protein
MSVLCKSLYEYFPFISTHRSFTISIPTKCTYSQQMCNYTGRFIMLSTITNIYNKKTPNAYAEPSILLFSTLIAPQLQFPLISSDYAENWPEPVQRHLRRLMGNHLISACTDNQFALCTICMLHSNHRFTRMIFQHTKRLLSRIGHFLTTYTRIA